MGSIYKKNTLNSAIGFQLLKDYGINVADFENANPILKQKSTQKIRFSCCAKNSKGKSIIRQKLMVSLLTLKI